MDNTKLLFGSFALGAGLVATRLLFSKPTSEKPASNSASYDAIDAYIEEQMRRLNIPGISLAIVEGDRVIHYRGFGRARPGGEAPSPQTPFVLGSTTKSFAALAAIQLVEAGKIDLDAPIQHYLPWFRVADSQASTCITVRHLLNQTSGLPGLPAMKSLADLDDSPDAAERQARAVSTLKLTRSAGSAFEYSNLNYYLLGLIPLLQSVGVAVTPQLLHHWHHDPQCRPSRARVGGLHILLPLIPNLSLVALPIFLQVKGMVRYMRLYMPDLAWIALICGGFAGMWTVLRAKLILRTLRKPAAH